MSEDFISGLHADLVEAMDRYERRSPRGRLAAGRYPHLLRRATLARVAAGAALIVALVAVVLAVWRESDVERPAEPPGKKVVATDVERGVRFSLDGRVLTVQLLAPVRNQTFARHPPKARPCLLPFQGCLSHTFTRSGYLRRCVPPHRRARRVHSGRRARHR
jgi:hypothetical protein